MSMVRPAGAVALQSLAFIVSWLINTPALAQEFRALLSSDLSTILNTYQGSTTNGNTMTRHSRFQNISGIPFEITGVVDVQSLDPEDLGYPDLTLENVTAAKAVMAALHPNTDLFAYTLWIGGEQSRRTWETEITFGSPFPILVNPGDEFEFVQVSRNDLFGPNFGPSTAPLPAAQTEFIGEIVSAFDFNWHYVPEPACALLLICGGLLGLPRLRVFPVGR